ncbi:MAG: 3-isopropylmalate dehydrogenase, partial [candidate division NC10 bacterium]
PDVIAEGIKVLEAVARVTGARLDLVHFDLSAERYLRTGETLPQPVFEDLRDNYDAIYLGALGDPRVPDMKHAADILLGLRFRLDLFVNMRPVKLLDRRLCPLKNRLEGDVDFVVFRENTEGLYVGMGGFFKKGTADEVAVQEDVNTRKGVERIIEYAFRFAHETKRTKVTMSDKANVLTYGHDLWQRVFREVAGRYPDIEAEHLYVDALGMQLVRAPQRFQVIVTCNMFGDILTDLGAALQGGLGMAASGNLNPERTPLFEPVHGSAPKYAGKDVANPMGAVLTAGMMLEYLGLRQEAALLDAAVREAIRQDKVTSDLGGTLGTKAVGDFLCHHIEKG